MGISPPPSETRNNSGIENWPRGSWGSRPVLPIGAQRWCSPSLLARLPLVPESSIWVGRRRLALKDYRSKKVLRKCALEMIRAWLTTLPLRSDVTMADFSQVPLGRLPYGMVTALPVLLQNKWNVQWEIASTVSATQRDVNTECGCLTTWLEENTGQGNVLGKVCFSCRHGSSALNYTWVRA